METKIPHCGHFILIVTIGAGRAFVSKARFPQEEQAIASMFGSRIWAYLPFPDYIYMRPGIVTVSHLSCAILRSPRRDAGQIAR